MIKVLKNKELIQEVVKRSISVIYPSEDKLKEILIGAKKPLKIYLGIDPTGPSLHLGHLTNLLVLKRLQKLGHKIIFLVGDFTGRIGDPTGKMSARGSLGEKEVRVNARTFKSQASRIISFSGKNPAEIKFNSDWYKKMNLNRFMNLVGYFTVKNMLNRDMFVERKKNQNEEAWLDSINLKELIYPLLQGYDGVELDVDVELGGNDQLFNMSIGRALRHSYSEEGAIPKTRKGEKFFIATTLLVDPKTGKKIMNKSEGGTINLDDKPEDVFGKIMALSDEAMFQVAEHSSEMDLNEIRELKESSVKGGVNPRNVKARIAKEVVGTIFGEKIAKEVEENFEKIFSKKEAPSDAPIIKLKNKKISASDLVFLSGVVKSKGEAWRLVEQGALSVGGEVKKNPKEVLELKLGDDLKIGKKSFFKVN